jgi:hypothetical protein
MTSTAASSSSSLIPAFLASARRRSTHGSQSRIIATVRPMSIFSGSMRQKGSRPLVSHNPMAVSKAGTGSLRSIGKTASPANNTAFGSSLGANRNLQCSVLLRSVCKPRRATIVDPVAGHDAAIQIASWSDRVSPKGPMALPVAGLWIEIQNPALASSIQMLFGRTGLEILYHHRPRYCRAHTSWPLSNSPSGNNPPNTTPQDPGLERAKSNSAVASLSHAGRRFCTPAAAINTSGGSEMIKYRGWKIGLNRIENKKLPSTGRKSQLHKKA